MSSSGRQQCLVGSTSRGEPHSEFPFLSEHILLFLRRRRDATTCSPNLATFIHLVVVALIQPPTSHKAKHIHIVFLPRTQQRSPHPLHTSSSKRTRRPSTNSTTSNGGHNCALQFIRRRARAGAPQKNGTINNARSADSSPLIRLGTIIVVVVVVVTSCCQCCCSPSRRRR